MFSKKRTITVGTFMQRRKKKFKLKVKSNKVMGDYICLHGLVPKNELPVRFRGKIPKDEIWIRKNVYENKKRRKAIMEHEKRELDLMCFYGHNYPEAHKKAQIREKLWVFRDAKEKVESEILDRYIK
jgi:hypothetical protein